MRGGKKDKFRRFNIWLLVILERKMRENGWKEIGKKKMFLRFGGREVLDWKGIINI